MVPHNSAAQIVVFQGCQGTASIWWVDKAGDLRFVRRASWHRRRFVPINAHGAVHFTGTQLILELWRYADFSLLVACRRDNVTADAAGRVGIFPLDLPELFHDAADSG